MRRTSIAIAAALATLPGAVICPSAHAEGVSLPVMQQIVAHIPLKAQWKVIEIFDEKRASNRVTLWYKETSSSPSDLEVEADTENIATQIIKGLMASGHDPQKEWNGFHVFAEQGGFTTVTGKPAVKSFGYTYYNYNDDALIWEPR